MGRTSIISIVNINVVVLCEYLPQEFSFCDTIKDYCIVLYSGIRPPYRLHQQPINKPGRVEGLKSAADSQSLVNRSYLLRGIVVLVFHQVACRITTTYTLVAWR